MASNVSVVVELGLVPTTGAFILGTSLLGGADVLTTGYNWTNITAYVDQSSLSWSHGATRSQGPWFRYEAGRCSFTLDDNDGGRFSPLNTTGPYALAGVSQLRPGIPVRVRVPWNDGATLSDYVAFTGWIDVWQPSNTGDRWSKVSVTATDGVERLQSANLPALATAVGAGDTAGARINRILDNVGWSTVNRNIDVTGTTTMQATTMAPSAWEEMLLTADSAAGFLFLSDDGKVTYRERSSISSSSVFTFDGLGVDAVDEQVSLSYDRQQVINQVCLARAGGTAQYVEDATSSADAQNGMRTYSRSDLICETDAQVQEIAQYLLFYFATLRYRVDQITLPLLTGSDTTFDNQWVHATWQTLTDRVRVNLPQPNSQTVNQQGLIRGISWQMGEAGTATVTVSLQQTPTASDPFTLGVSLLGGAQVLAPF